MTSNAIRSCLKRKRPDTFLTVTLQHQNRGPECYNTFPLPTRSFEKSTNSISLRSILSVKILSPLIRWKHLECEEHTSLLLTYSKLMCDGDSFNFCQNLNVPTALTINKRCELWSIIHPDRAITELNEFTNNLNRYHKSHLLMIDKFIFNVLRENSIKDGWEELVDDIALFVNLRGMHCSHIFAIMMGLVGHHDLWNQVKEKTINVEYRNVYDIMFNL